jgi:hypothetical protein
MDPGLADHPRSTLDLLAWLTATLVQATCGPTAAATATVRWRQER